IVEAHAQPTGIKWIDGFNAMLRPAASTGVIVLLFWVSVVYVHGATSQYMAGTITVEELHTAIWGSMIGEAIVAVLGFLFGYRGAVKCAKTCRAMALPKEALDLIKEFEGYLKRLNDGTDRVKPYLCPAGVPTIGWGTTRYPDGRRLKLSDPPINKKTATTYLEHELTEDERAFDRLTTVRLPPLARGALVSFVYNCGAGAYQCSTLSKRVNAGRWADVPKELAKWKYGGGKVLPGLVRRQIGRAELFLR